MKVVINGETLEYDREKRLMSEAIAIERAWGRRFAEWETELVAGSAEAVAVFVWTVWRRDGRDVALEDILSGEVDVDYSEVLRSLAAAAAEDAKAEPDPTSGAAPRTVPDGMSSTAAATSGRSRKSSASRPGTPES